MKIPADATLVESGNAAHSTHAANCQIAIVNQQSLLEVDQARLCEIARCVLQEEKVRSADLSIAIVDDTTIHAVNREFLRHDYATDVISFSLSETGSSNPQQGTLDGEIVISAETALQSAAELSCEPADELALYLIHGLLHLCGYDDRSANDRAQMRSREQSLLQKMGISAHYKS